jgi:flagellar assembly protein FliH
MESFDQSSGAEVRRNGDEYVFEPYDSNSREKDYPFDCVVPEDGKCAEEIVAHSEDIIRRAKQRAYEIEREAYEKGFEQGEKDGIELGGKKVDKVLSRVEELLKEIQTHKVRFIAENEKEILNLIGRVAERVVKGSVLLDREVIRKTILEAFSLVSDSSEVTVKVSEEDLEYVKEMRPEFFKKIEGLEAIVMQADPTVTRGGCILEARSGTVDARLEKQLEKIVSVLECHDGSGQQESEEQA